MAEMISSRENAKIKYACKLQQSPAFREKEKLFFAEGPKLCLELAKGCKNTVLYYTQRAVEQYPQLTELDGVQYIVSESVAEKLAGVPSPQGVFGLFELPEVSISDLKPKGHYLCLEAVQDPGNVGTLIRSGAAFGFDGVICSKKCASPFGEKALRASMGAAGRIPVVQVENMPQAVEHLRQIGVFTVAAALYNSRPLEEAKGPFSNGVAVVIGNEGQGLTQDTIEACDIAVRIPISQQVESLNAAAAGAVLTWHFRKGEYT